MFPPESDEDSENAEYDDGFANLNLEDFDVSSRFVMTNRPKGESNYGQMRPRSGQDLHTGVRRGHEYLLSRQVTSRRDDQNTSFLHRSGYFREDQLYQPGTSTKSRLIRRNVSLDSNEDSENHMHDDEFAQLNLQNLNVSSRFVMTNGPNEESYYEQMRPSPGQNNSHQGVRRGHEYLLSRQVTGGHEVQDTSVLHPSAGCFGEEQLYQPRTSTERFVMTNSPNGENYYEQIRPSPGQNLHQGVRRGHEYLLPRQVTGRNEAQDTPVLHPSAGCFGEEQLYQPKTSTERFLSMKKNVPEEKYLKNSASLFQEPVGTGSLLVASIDFGTTYSSWAISFKTDFEKDPTKSFAKVWMGQKLSQKGPTCVLIEPDGETLHSFGYEAETTYAQFAEEQKHKDWYFFKNFKMMLFDKMRLGRDVMLEDITGRSLPAITIFSLSIKYLGEDLLDASNQKLLGGLTENEVHWVLTVPAIWTDAAKQFMREAAQKAGIPKHKLTICLEPEAASLYCRHIPVAKTNGEEQVSLGSFKAGTKYLVVDAGGGTVDTTVHEVVNKSTIREVYKASGGAWGGTKVDKAFENFLEEMLGHRVLKEFKDDHMEDYIELFKDFELKKRETTPFSDLKITIRIPLTLFDIVSKLSGQTFEELAKRSTYSRQLTVVRDKLRMEADLMRSFFDSAIGRISQHIHGLLQKPLLSDCTAVVLVGGFSESKLLQESIRQSFRHVNVIIPDEAGLVVLKGATIFGHSPLAISERVSKFTYGQSVSHLTSSHCWHPRGLQGLDENGELRCYDIFEVHARLGQAVKIGEETIPKFGGPIYDDQETFLCQIYVSTDPNPQLVTETSCKEVGSFVVPIKGNLPVKDRIFEVSFKFGGTEIEVKVVDKATGETTIGHVDFLG